VSNLGEGEGKNLLFSLGYFSKRKEHLSVFLLFLCCTVWLLEWYVGRKVSEINCTSQCYGECLTLLAESSKEGVLLQKVGVELLEDLP
jgi:hypothetical protein